MNLEDALNQARVIFEVADMLASSGKKLKLNELGADSVIIVVDMVNGFAKRGALSSPRVGALAGGIRGVCEAAAERGAAILFLCDSHTEDSPEFDIYPPHCVTGTAEAELICELRGFGPIIEKTSTNGLLEPLFMAWLEEHRNIETFVITGDCTDICVLQLALSLNALFTRLNKRKRVVVPANLTDTFDGPGHGADAMKAFALAALNGAGVEVVSGVE